MKKGEEDYTEKQSKVKQIWWKVLVVGEPGTGKTSIIQRYVTNSFNPNQRNTIGYDFALKKIQHNDNLCLNMQLWDIAGQERYGNMTRVYYQEAVGAFIVFDVTKPQTFDRLLIWKKDIDSKVRLPPDDRPIPVVLLANKCDLLPNNDQSKDGGVFFKTKTDMDQYCEENNYISWFQTSAKLNINIEQASNDLVKHLCDELLSKPNKEENQDDKRKVNLVNIDQPPNQCC